MIEKRRPGGLTAVDLREAFDSSFAQAARTDEGPYEDLLAIRVGQSPFAVRLAEVAELMADPIVTRLPSALPELVGVVSAQGAILPVYDRRAVLGVSGSSRNLRWLLVTAGSAVALAFDASEGRFRTPREAVVGRAGDGAARDVVSTDLLLRPVLHLSAVLDTIGALVRQRMRSRSDER